MAGSPTLDSLALETPELLATSPPEELKAELTVWTSAEVHTSANQKSSEEELVELRQSLAEQERTLGLENLDVYIASSQQVFILQQRMGMFDSAKATLEHALTVIRALGAEHTLCHAQVLHNLAAFMKSDLARQNLDAGRRNTGLLEVLTMFREALDIKRELVGTEDGSYVLTLHNVGLCHKDLGQFQQALVVLQDALKIKSKLLGKDTLSSAETMTVIANIYLTEGQHREAIELLSEVRRIQVAALPDPKKKDTGEQVAFCSTDTYSSTLNNLALAHSKCGNLAEAIAIFREGLAVVENFHGNKSSKYGDIAYNLAIVYRKNNEDESALGWYSEAAEAYCALYGDKHSRTLDAIARRTELTHKVSRGTCCSSSYTERVAGDGSDQEKDVSSAWGSILTACQGRS